MIKAIVFDLDDTLYDYISCNRIAEEVLYKKLNELFDISEEEATTKLYEAKKRVKKQLGNTAAAHNRLLYMQTLCELLDKNPIKYTKLLYDCYWDTMLDNMEMFDYVIPLFEEIKRRDIKIGILTDLTAHIQIRKLNKLGIEDYIDVLVTSEEAGEEKPSDKMFELVLKKLNCNPDQVVMIGDSYEKDIMGAKKMGMKTIHFKERDGFYFETRSILG